MVKASSDKITTFLQDLKEFFLGENTVKKTYQSAGQRGAVRLDRQSNGK